MSERAKYEYVDLVGYRLGLLEKADRAEIEARLSAAELQAACGGIDRLLRPLAFDHVSIPPSLCDGVMNRIHSLQHTYTLPSTPRLSPATDAPAHSGSGFSLRELLSLAAAIVIFVGILIPGYHSARLASQRTICQDNLRTIGRGIAHYADVSGGQLPYVSGVPMNAAWAPPTSAAPGYRYVNNSRNLYPLVQQRFVSPTAFVERAGDSPMSLQQVTESDNFVSPRNNSYSIHFIDQPLHQAAFPPTTPLVSDFTPLFNDNRQLISGPIPINSTTHGRLNGQNVLRGDLSVIWTRTPNVGLGNDDIYRLIGVQKYTGHERPANRTDSFLIP